MDEKLQSILDCVRNTAAVITDTAADMAYGAGAAARELLSVGKMNARLAEKKAGVHTELRHVGEMIYATHTGNPTDSDTLLAKLREIDELHAEIAGLEREIAAAKGLPVCGACGNIGVKGDLFCRECGSKI